MILRRRLFPRPRPRSPLRSRSARSRSTTPYRSTVRRKSRSRSVTPPGRRGVEPSLALTYSSRGGNGPLGVGWSLSGLSVITSCRRSPALDEAYGGTYPDRLCLDGARLVEVNRSLAPANSSAEYRSETDSYRKVIGRPYWTQSRLS